MSRTIEILNYLPVDWRSPALQASLWELRLRRAFVLWKFYDWRLESQGERHRTARSRFSSVTSEHSEVAEAAGSEEQNAQEQEEHRHAHEQEEEEEEEIITPATCPSHLPRDHVQHLNTHGLGLPTASPVSDSTDQFCC